MREMFPFLIIITNSPCYHLGEFFYRNIAQTIALFTTARGVVYDYECARPFTIIRKRREKLKSNIENFADGAEASYTFIIAL